MHDASNDGLFAVLVDELKLADPEMVTEILTYIYSERRELIYKKPWPTMADNFNLTMSSWQTKTRLVNDLINRRTNQSMPWEHDYKYSSA